MACGQLEALHSIWPDLQMLKQLGPEVQEAEVKMNQFENIVKGLQRELEVEEGEHRSTGELVLELKEVGEDVQVVESLQRELEPLEEKLAELGSRVREGHLGLQAAHLGRDCPGLLLQPIITSLALPFLANSLLHIGQGGAKKT